MSWTNDSLISTSYTNESSTSLVSWADPDSYWGDANISWTGAGNSFAFDTELSTTYTNDTI